MNKLIALLMLLALMACKSTKTSMKSDVRQNTEVKKDVTESASLQSSSVTNQVITDLSTQTDSVIIHAVTLNFSKPDSTGKQFVESATITDINSSKHRANNVKASTANNVKVTANTAKKDNTKSKSKSREKTETFETPLWQILLNRIGAVVGFVIVILILLYFLKK